MGEFYFIYTLSEEYTRYCNRARKLTRRSLSVITIPCAHPIELSYDNTLDGSVCWMFATRTISVGLYNNIGT